MKHRRETSQMKYASGQNIWCFILCCYYFLMNTPKVVANPPLENARERFHPQPQRHFSLNVPVALESLTRKWRGNPSWFQIHDPCRKPADLHNLAPGTHPPFLTYNGEVKTDINKIEEFLEEVLAPPKYVRVHSDTLSPRLRRQKCLFLMMSTVPGFIKRLVEKIWSFLNITHETHSPFL